MKLLQSYSLLAFAVGIASLPLNAASYQDQQREEADQRAKDPKWKPKMVEVAQLRIGDIGSPGSLKNFCLDGEGNILACFAGGKADKKEGSVGLYTPKGALLKKMPITINPQAIGVSTDGSIFVAGDGKLLKLDKEGKTVASVDSPVVNIPVVITKEMEALIKESGRSSPQELENMKRSLDQRRSSFTGLTVSDQDVFVAVPTPNEFTYQIYRYDHALQNQKLVVEKLRGCCGQMDIQSHKGNLWIPHNARHAIESHDRDGKQLTKFGTAGKIRAQDFGGCCEPKNMRVLANGDILAAESGPPTCIKRFTPDGKFIEVVAVVEGPGECVRVTVAAAADGNTFYMLDTHIDAIRVFGPRS